MSRLAKNNKFCRLISETKRIKIVFCIYCFKKTIFLRFVKSEVKHSVANKALVVVGRQCVVGPPCWINSFGGAASAISSQPPASILGSRAFLLRFDVAASFTRGGIPNILYLTTS